MENNVDIVKKNIIKWLWLLHSLGNKPYKLSRIHKQIGSIDTIYNSNIDDIMAIGGLDDNEIEGLNNKDLTSAEKTFRFCMSKGIDIISIDDDLFPQELKEIDNYPCVLFCYGNAKAALSKPRIAIVGTREATSYGVTNTKMLSAALSKAGFCIVTGVADGIDAAAIAGATSVGGSVISFLPGGHTNSLISSNYKFKQIFNNGALLSEHLPDTHTSKYAYHTRNRLISGVSLGTIVTQAPISSGALITANCAVNQNRDVFALVANADMEQSAGSNLLLRDGAIPLIDYTDVVNFYIHQLKDKLTTDFTLDKNEIPNETNDMQQDRLEDFRRAAAKHLDHTQKLIFENLDIVETDIDAIIEQTGLPVSTVMSALADMEANGIIVSRPGNIYKISI